MNFRRLAAADAEISEAADWYDRQRPLLGDDFTAEVEHAFERISRNPLIYERVVLSAGRKDVRRCRLQRFPYLIVYRHQPDETLIVAVAHVRRKPYYWLERLK